MQRFCKVALLGICCKVQSFISCASHVRNNLTVAWGGGMVSRYVGRE